MLVVSLLVLLVLLVWLLPLLCAAGV